MGLSSWIPKFLRPMIITSKRVDPNGEDADLIAFEREHQHDKRLCSQINGDKVRAVKRNAEEIRKVKSFLKHAKDGSESKVRLEHWLDDLYAEQFGLLKEDYLNAVKDSAGLIDIARLRKIPGSAKFIKNLEKRKEKNDTKHITRNPKTNHKS